jgi:hypothetical protein
MWFKTLPLLLLAACSQEAGIPSVASAQPPAAAPLDRSVDIVKMDEGAELVQAHCGTCHSLALVEQNRMTRTGWVRTIRWMQEKQGLWDLGEAEVLIVDYLASNYGVVEVPWRRKPLQLPDDSGP